MNVTAEKLFKEALTLPLPEILDLMDRLEEHVEPLLTPPQEQEFEMSPEWDAEIKRRLEDIESGRAKLISCDEFFASLRAEESDDESDPVG